jgi:hypothetical protein
MTIYFSCSRGRMLRIQPEGAAKHPDCPHGFCGKEFLP